MLDYAANSSRYWSVDTIKERFRAGVDDPDSQLMDLLGEESSSEAFWEDVETNLERGKIRLLFVADNIPSELKSIVEFLNEQMDPAEVLAVEIGHYEGHGEEALVPHVIGQTEAARQKKGSRTRKDWNEESFLTTAQDNLDSDVYEKFKRLYRFLKEESDSHSWGSGAQIGSCIFYWNELTTDGKSAFILNTEGRIRLQFKFMKDGYADRLRDELRGIGFDSGLDLVQPKFKTSWPPVTDEFIQVLRDIRDET